MVADHEFKVNSPAQKLDLIYGVRRCRPRNARGRPLGKDSKLKPSAGALALKQAKLEHPIVNHIIRAMEDVMESDKQMSNVTGRLDTEGRVEGGIRFYTDRFRTAYGAAGTTSTRLSSKSSDFWDGTNAQNIRGTFRDRSEEHTSELQSLMRISYAVFCLKKKTQYSHKLMITISTPITNAHSIHPQV